jgi:hypothetical protein
VVVFRLIAAQLLDIEHGHAAPVRALLKRALNAQIETLVLAQLAPRHRVPRCFVGPVALHCLEDETGFDQLAFCALDDISRLPSPRGQMRTGQQQAPVVVTPELACNFQQQ